MDFEELRTSVSLEGVLLNPFLGKVFLLEDRCELGSRQNAGSEVGWADCEGKEQELPVIQGCGNSALTVSE